MSYPLPNLLSMVVHQPWTRFGSYMTTFWTDGLQICLFAWYLMMSDMPLDQCNTILLKLYFAYFTSPVA